MTPAPPQDAGLEGALHKATGEEPSAKHLQADPDLQEQDLKVPQSQGGAPRLTVLGHSDSAAGAGMHICCCLLLLPEAAAALAAAWWPPGLGLASRPSSLPVWRVSGSLPHPVVVLAGSAPPAGWADSRACQAASMLSLRRLPAVRRCALQSHRPLIEAACARPTWPVTAGEALHKARQGRARRRVMDEVEFVVAFLRCVFFVPLGALLLSVAHNSIPACFGTWTRAKHTLKCAPPAGGCPQAALSEGSAQAAAGHGAVPGLGCMAPTAVVRKCSISVSSLMQALPHCARGRTSPHRLSCHARVAMPHACLRRL